MAESQKEKLMRVLECTEAEAEDIIATDKLIDQGKRTPYDLDPEKERKPRNLPTPRPELFTISTPPTENGKPIPQKKELSQNFTNFCKNRAVLR